MYITQNAHTVVDGRGFAAQKKNAIPGGVEVEKGIFSGEREISSLQFAIVSIQSIRNVVATVYSIAPLPFNFSVFSQSNSASCLHCSWTGGRYRLTMTCYKLLLCHYESIVVHRHFAVGLCGVKYSQSRWRWPAP